MQVGTPPRPEQTKIQGRERVPTYEFSGFGLFEDWILGFVPGIATTQSDIELDYTSCVRAAESGTTDARNGDTDAGMHNVIDTWWPLSEATKAEIVGKIREFADAGGSVIMISSELPELLAVSDRILILRDGHVESAIDRSQIEREEDLHHAVQGMTA